MVPSNSRFVNCFKSCILANVAPPPEVALKVKTEETQYTIKLQANCKVMHLLQRVMYNEGYWPNTPADLDCVLQTPDGAVLNKSTSLSDLEGDVFFFAVEKLEPKPVQNVFSGRRCGKCDCTVSSVCHACQELPDRGDTLVRFASRISCQSSDVFVRLASRLSCNSSEGLVRMSSKLSNNSGLVNLSCRDAEISGLCAQ